MLFIKSREEKVNNELTKLYSSVETGKRTAECDWDY